MYAITSTFFYSPVGVFTKIVGDNVNPFIGEKVTLKLVISGILILSAGLILINFQSNKKELG